MQVRKWMKHPVQAVKPLDSIQHARELMVEHRINQLPVLVDGRLVGIITDRDLRDAFPSVFDVKAFSAKRRKDASDPRAVTVEMVMAPDVVTVGPADSMAGAAELMRQQRIGSLPVVEAGRVIGILTRSDVLDCLVAVTGTTPRRQGGPVRKAAAARAPKTAAAKAPRRRRSA